MKLRAFTLIELLVVIAIIALLMAIIMPGLSLAKRKAAATVCLGNTKNLSMGWYMHMQDNDGRIMSSTSEAVDDKGAHVGWCRDPRDASYNLLSNNQTEPAVTDADEKRGIKMGVLYPYVKSPDAYHCPGDNVRKSMYDGTRVFVTYAMPACLYQAPKKSESRYNIQIRIFDEITAPSTRYVFVETAEERNWNMNQRFILGAPEYTDNFSEWAWWNPMAINHGDSSIMGFCDGHSEVRKWRDTFTIERVDKLMNQGVTLYGIEYPPQGQTSDIKYMADGWAYRHKGAR